mmetsp:Transcript_31397/g.47693  ORF Transcript_31397/g.47693 Transcript_31397/m.47693 type:complete len:483 (+) Transcript_31397:996-2444(+)
METLYNGEKNRIVASTDMNARSSRSHSIFSITIESRESRGGTGRSNSFIGAVGDEEDDRAVLVSMLNLVDLAGSESAKNTNATGTRQREGGKINQSLLTLSQVIQSLSMPKGKRPSHINYRDSKLTRILRPSLEGNAVMAILCCATASRMYVEETKSTLRFASRAKLVQTSAKKNEVMDDRTLIRRLQKELADAKEALKQMEVEKDRSKVSVPELPSELDAKRESRYRARVSQLNSVLLRGGEGLSLGRKVTSDDGMVNMRNNSFSRTQNTNGRRSTLGCGELKKSIDEANLEAPKKKKFKPRGSIFFEDHIVDLPLFDEEDDCSSDEENMATPVAEQRKTHNPLENGNYQTNEPQHRRSSEADLLKTALELKSNRLAEAEARISELEKETIKYMEKEKILTRQNRKNIFFLSAFQLSLLLFTLNFIANKWGSMGNLGQTATAIVFAEYILVLFQWNFLLHFCGYKVPVSFLFNKQHASSSR